MSNPIYYTGSDYVNGNDFGGFWSGALYNLANPTAYSASINSHEAAKDRLFQADQADLAYQRQLYMSNTAYQRATEDMRKAGLNPYLAYNQGGASSPSVSSASGSRASTSPNSGALLGLLNTALSFVMRGADMNLDKQRVALEREKITNSALRASLDDKVKQSQIARNMQQGEYYKQLGLNAYKARTSQKNNSSGDWRTKRYF